MKSVVVTGVSTGIGLGTARVLLSKGFRVFGSVRKPADAERLASELGTRFIPLLFDVTDQAAVHGAAAEVRSCLQGTRLAGLVNNAGIAVPGPLLHQPIADFRYQLEVNLVSPLIVTQAFAPLLGTDRSLAGPPGRIVNMSSVAGKIAAPFLGAYAASKHGLEGFSESLRRELLLYGIDVIVIGPGAVATPIWDKAEAEEFAAYRRSDYAQLLEKFKAYFIAEGRRGFSPEQVGLTVLEALTAPKPGARYAVVPNRFFNWALPRLLPTRVLDGIIAKRLGLQ